MNWLLGSEYEYEYEYRGAEYEWWLTVRTAIRVVKSAAEAYIVEV